MKKKNIALCLSLMMVAGSMVACGKKGGDSSTTPAPESSVPAATSEVVATSEKTSEAHVHSFGEWTVTKPATHTEEGEETRTCSCGEKETRPVAKTTDHQFGEWTETKAPTCLEKGKAERTCACGEKETKDIPAKGHSAASTWSSDATGHWHTCANNAEEKLDFATHTLFTNKDALAHWEECSVCGWQGEKVGHTFTNEKNDAHKTSDGSPDAGAQYEETCSCGQRNGVTYSDDALVAKSYKMKTEPTLTEKGVVTFTYEGYGDKDYYIPSLSSTTFWSANVINKSCESYQAEYTFTGSLLGPASLWCLSIGEDYATLGAKKVLLTSSVLVGCKVSTSTVRDHELDYVAPTEACGQGQSGYYECLRDGCGAMFLDDEGTTKATETDLLPLEATVVNAAMRNGEPTIQLRIAQGNVQWGRDLFVYPSTGEAAISVQVVTINVGYAGSTVSSFANKDSGNVYINVSLHGDATIDDIKVGDRITNYFDDHNFNEEGFCPCGFNNNFYQNVYMVTGRVIDAADGGSAQDLMAGSTLKASFRSGLEDITFSTVTDTSISFADEDYLSRNSIVKNGNNFTAKVWIPNMGDLEKGGTFEVLNGASEIVARVTITSLIYQYIEAVSGSPASFYCDGRSDSYVDSIHMQYYTSTKLETPVEEEDLTIACPSSKCSASADIASIEAIAGRGVAVEFQVTQGTFSNTDAFTIFNYDTSVAVGSKSLIVTEMKVNGASATTAAKGDIVSILFRTFDIPSGEYFFLGINYQA